MTIQFKNTFGENGEYQLRDRMMDLIRKTPILDSYTGVRVYDIDGFIWNKNTNSAFIVENKTYMAEPKPDQLLTLFKIDESFKKLDDLNKGIFNWKGIFLIQFENTGPDDGFTKISRMKEGTFIEKKVINNEEDLWKIFKYLLKK